MDNPIIKMENITKTFPGVKALDDISIDFYRGCVHILIGENGAGKSTLMKILSGIYKLEKGALVYKNEKVAFDNPKQALDKGISVIHQELSVINDLTVAENIFLGREDRFRKNRLCLLDKSKMNCEANKILESMEMDIDPNIIVSKLSTAKKQMVEIAKAVSQDASVIVMDEPTSSIAENEVRALFKLIRELKKKGTAIIYISHRMKEIFEIGDRVSVLRDGQHIKTTDISNVTVDELISLMVGREIKKMFYKREHPLGDDILRVEKLCKQNKFKDISFVLKKGEILGVAGLIGAGRTEVLMSLFGVEKPDSGIIYLEGEEVNITSPSIAIKNKIGLVPEDRRCQGLLLEDYVKTNISLPMLKRNSKYGFVDFLWETQIATRFVNKMGIKTPSISSKVKNLSGGNQQKIVLAKWMASNTQILLLDEPTRGVDVKAKSEIYALINNFVREGGSVMMVSSELPEILGVCDRVIVMREGAISGEIQIENADEEKLMKLASLN